MARDALLQAFSLLVTGFVLFSVFAVHTGLVGQFYVLPATVTLASAVGLRYAGVYHRFSKPVYRILALVPFLVGFLTAGAVALDTVRAALSLETLRGVFQQEPVRLGAPNFLPEWWFAVPLVLAGALILAGAVLRSDLVPYSKPTDVREVAVSPPYFGFACTFFGLWAVLFVGFAVQRLLVVAPLFEELLKFGVALLVGSTLFGRSALARIGVAVVVGALFGVVEHATTYPTEADRVYLFRTLFHATMTVLSVAVYTVFESRNAVRLQSIAPACATTLHLSYNAFVVLSGIIGVLVWGAPNTTVSLVYGSGAILLAAGLLVVAATRQSALVAIYRPIEHALSAFV